MQVNEAKPVEIFWGEAYGHAADQLWYRDHELRSCLSYLLLADRIVLHPVSIWQSLCARRLILDGRLHARSNPPGVLLMSRDETVRTYLDDRVPQLERLRAENPVAATELKFYELHRERLADECDLLDDAFTSRDGMFVASWNKPALHRKLIQVDLADKHGFGDHLARKIIDTRAGSTYEAVQCCDRISRAAQDPDRFFSTDVVLDELTSHGWSLDAMHAIRRRLAVLLLRANAADELHVPLVSSASRNVLDPFDPTVFWSAMERLLGVRLVRALFREDDPVDVCLLLRKMPEWERFVPVYRQLVTEVADVVRGVDEGVLAKRLRERFPSMFPYLWNRTGKISTAALLCSLSTVSMESLQLCAIAATGLSTTACLINTLSGLVRYIHSERVSLCYRVRTMLHPENRYWRVSPLFQ